MCIDLRTPLGMRGITITDPACLLLPLMCIDLSTPLGMRGITITDPTCLPTAPATAYRRIDGSTPLDMREIAIQDFNRPNSEVFIFLLSIRAAGRGLNLQVGGWGGGSEQGGQGPPPAGGGKGV